MSDSGFADEARADRAKPARTGPADRPSPSGPRRGTRAFAIAFVVLLVGLLAFLAVALSARLHSDDVAAWQAAADEVEVLDRDLTPLGHSEIAPCRDTTEGRVTRTYPPSTGPQATELVDALTQQGWTQTPATPPAYARLTRTLVGHEVSVVVAARDGASLVDSLTATSPASAFGCLLH
ncbi:MAG: hypothetical protein ACKOVB_02640 [Terrabacter sp.]